MLLNKYKLAKLKYRYSNQTLDLFSTMTMDKPESQVQAKAKPSAQRSPSPGLVELIYGCYGLRIWDLDSGLSISFSEEK